MSSSGPGMAELIGPSRMGDMARLLLINGLPGSGNRPSRSVMSRTGRCRCLDIDVVRGLLGEWLNQPLEAGLLARRVALAMAQVVLGEGRDVVVPQFLGRPGFIGELEALARRLAVEFVEVVLLDEAEVAVARLAHRAAGPMTGTQRDAHLLLDRDGGLGAVAEMHDRLQVVLAERPGARRVVPVPGDVERTYQSLLECLRPEGR